MQYVGRMGVGVWGPQGYVVWGVDIGGSFPAGPPTAPMDVVASALVAGARVSFVASKGNGSPVRV